MFYFIKKFKILYNWTKLPTLNLSSIEPLLLLDAEFSNGKVESTYLFGPTIFSSNIMSVLEVSVRSEVIYFKIIAADNFI